MSRSIEFADYDEDFFTWTQQQASALRALPRADVRTAVDILHVAEEIEDLGTRDLLGFARGLSVVDLGSPRRGV